MAIPKLRTYKFRPVRHLARLIARQLQKDSGFRVEISELSPNVTVINMTDEFHNGWKDTPKFINAKEE